MGPEKHLHDQRKSGQSFSLDCGRWSAASHTAAFFAQPGHRVRVAATVLLPLFFCSYNLSCTHVPIACGHSCCPRFPLPFADFPCRLPSLVLGCYASPLRPTGLSYKSAPPVFLHTRPVCCLLQLLPVRAAGDCAGWDKRLGVSGVCRAAHQRHGP